jgi:ADP-ribose pyrophosphatase YjhB (NUDIX family)
MRVDQFRRVWEPAIRRAMHVYWRFARGLTVGVRAVVVDAGGKVFLIEHSYVNGWHLPGGGVETGEAVPAALARELLEEGNIEIAAPPELFGIYFNRGASRRDHVALYVVRAFRQIAPPQPNREIVAHGFFALDALPEGTTRGTRARLAEIFGGQPAAEIW